MGSTECWLLRPHAKVNSGGFIDLNVDGETISLLENNAREYLQVFTIGKDFLNRMLRKINHKLKLRNSDYQKIPKDYQKILRG